MSRKDRNNYTAAEKVAILRRHLLDGLRYRSYAKNTNCSQQYSIDGRSSFSRTGRQPSTALGIKRARDPRRGSRIWRRNWLTRMRYWRS